MLQINKKYNDQNIARVYTKMSEQFTSPNSKAKLLNSNENVNYFHDLAKSVPIEDLNASYDHIYASNNTDNCVVSTSEESCQNAESEVRFLKDWLLVHLDLIQQQNDDILSKERTIFYLQQENEKLKEKIRCMESGAPFEANCNNNSSEFHSEFLEDMTQDSAPGEDNERVVDLETIPDCNIELGEYEIKQNNIESTTVKSPKSTLNFGVVNSLNKVEGINFISDNIKVSGSVSGESEAGNSSVNYNNLESSVVETESMKNLRMSIRRKRLCSSSSAFSNNESLVQEKRHCRKSKRKRKRIPKDEEILVYDDPYHTQTGENLFISPTDQELALAAASKNLEVPRWRVKVYASCYSMEGTENLEDGVYDRRHSRLEIDERRRKRWDVQRIREQRIIEKLKHRLEKNNRLSDQYNPVESLWPTLEDVKFLELCDHLPVSTLGSTIPRFTPSEFSLPWLNNVTIPVKKPKRLRGKRKGSKKIKH